MLGIRENPHEDAVAFGTARPGRQLVAFVVNPTKPGIAQLREAAYRACSMRYLPEPLWLYTTLDEPGAEVAKRAVDAGATVLVAVGGDGTVRAVAAAAAAASLPLGVIPLGTGNLLARNVGLPLTDSSAALRIALDGRESPVDMGWLTVTRESGDEHEHPFLVIAGLGLDAEMVASTRDSLKSRFGWFAYFIGALRHLSATRMNATVRVDDGEPVSGRMRTVLIANCGKLPGGVVLVPDARIDDGALDIATLDARGGIAGWAELFGQVWFQGTRLNAPTLPDAWRIGRIDHARGTSVDITAESPQRIQVDGESMGRAVRIRARIEPGALHVRSTIAPVRTRHAPSAPGNRA